MHLSPVFEEVFPEDVLGRVVVLQHFRKEGCHFLSTWTELHVFACGGKGADKTNQNINQASTKILLGPQNTEVTIAIEFNLFNSNRKGAYIDSHMDHLKGLYQTS